MLGLLASGGRALLINDVVSSERFPPLTRVPADELSDVMSKLIRERKCFIGLEPEAMMSALKADSRVARFSQVAPWLWHLGLERTYLVYAIHFDRRQEGYRNLVTPPAIEKSALVLPGEA